MEPRLSLVTLAVKDVARSLAFYQDVVGWTPAMTSDEVAFFQLGPVVFGLYRSDLFAREVDVAAADMAPGGAAIAHNLRSKAEVDALFAELVEKGATILVPPHDMPWGGYSGYFADPDGHRWEVAWNPFWTIAEDGSVEIGA